MPDHARGHLAGGKSAAQRAPFRDDRSADRDRAIGRLTRPLISLVGLGVARRLLSATPGPPVNPPHVGSSPTGLEMRLRCAATNFHNEQLHNRTLTEGVS